MKSVRFNYYQTARVRTDPFDMLECVFDGNRNSCDESDLLLPSTNGLQEEIESEDDEIKMDSTNFNAVDIYDDSNLADTVLEIPIVSI